MSESVARESFASSEDTFKLPRISIEDSISKLDVVDRLHDLPSASANIEECHLEETLDGSADQEQLERDGKTITTEDTAHDETIAESQIAEGIDVVPEDWGEEYYQPALGNTIFTLSDRFDRDDAAFFEQIFRIIETDDYVSTYILINAYRRLEKYADRLEEMGIDYKTIDPSRRINPADFCIEGKGNVSKFSPSKTVRAVIKKHFTLRMELDGQDIYWFDGQIFQPDGERKVDLLLCYVVEDLVDAKRISEVIRRVRNELLEHPVIFDGNPYLIGVRNGVVDLLTGKFRAYRPEDLITDKIDVAYDPGAKCPRFTEFLESIQPNAIDRETLKDWFVITAIKQPFPYVLFLLGLGRNGKGIYERLIKRLFGASAFRDMPLIEVAKNNFAAGEFYKKRGWIATETSGKKQAVIDTDFIKSVSGAGTIDANRKYKSRVQFEGYFQVIIDTNNMPPIEDTSRGWMERFCKQSFPYVFVDNPDPNNPLEKKKDPNLLDKLTSDEELSGILNMIISRAPKIIKSETITKRPAAELFSEYTRQSASAATFLEEFCEYDLLRYPLPEITEDIYEAYKEWCSYLVGEVVNDKVFGKEIREFCNGQKPKRLRVDGKKKTAYVGLVFHKDEVEKNIEALRGTKN